MIKIIKGDHVISVSKNTFETMYKRLGYKEVVAKKIEEPKKEETKIEEPKKEETKKAEK